MAACRHEAKQANEFAGVSDMRLQLLLRFQSQRLGLTHNNIPADVTHASLPMATTTRRAYVVWSGCSDLLDLCNVLPAVAAL